MWKKNRKHIARSEQNNFGCMWGLINMLDFRSTQKLLTDTDRSNSRSLSAGYLRNKLDALKASGRKPVNFSDANQMEPKNSTLGATTIQKLMEKEMSRDPKAGRIKPDSRPGGNLEKNHKQRRKNLKLTSADTEDWRTDVKKSNQSDCETPSCDLDLAELVQEINNQYMEKRKDFKSTIDLPAAESKHHYETDSQLTQKHLNLQLAQCGITEAFLNQKPMDAELQIGKDKFYQSKELMDVSDSQYFNNDLFEKLIQEVQSIDARKLSTFDSRVHSEGSELADSFVKSGKSEESVLRKSSPIKNAFFWRKDKSRTLSEGNGSDSSAQSLNRIVVLKPNPPRTQKPPELVCPGSSPRSDHSLPIDESTETIAFQYSLNKIKTKLRHAIGESRKDQLMIATDDVLHKIPHGSKDSTDMVRRFSEKKIQSGSQSETSSTKRRNKQAKLEHHSKLKQGTDLEQDFTNKNLTMDMTYNPLYQKSFSKKGKRHLPEIFTEGQNEALPNDQLASASLGRLIGYTFVSRKSNPGKGMESESSQNMRSSITIQLNQERPAKDRLKKDIENPPFAYIDQKDDPQVLDSHPGILDADHIESAKTLNTKGNVETKCMEERDHLAVCSDIDSHETTFTSERCTDEEYTSSLQSGSGSSEARSEVLNSSVSISFARKLKVSEILVENQGSPSPLSVLKPYVFEDISSPKSTSFEHVEYSLPPRKNHIEEHEVFQVVRAQPDSEENLRTFSENKEAKFEYVKTWLEVSGISSFTKLSKRLHLSDQLLDPSLCDEAEILCDNPPDELKLFFDCTNEVLVEMWEKFYRCTPWLSLIRPEVWLGTVGGNLIHEVYKDIEQRLHSHFPFSLDHTIKRDLDARTWMNCRSETESNVFDIGEAILDDLISKTILDMWTRSPGFSSDLDNS